ncbi:MAG: pyridine nucleotide-disulfide oxidoreductase [Planctomycetota bacterium]|nr:MAG: pyridine nucleotide-disulfide oxidoreductase [Planctomycetota bacterium]
MKNTDILVVGGSAAGVTAAISARRYYPNASITLVRKEKDVLIPCGIPYIIGTIGSPDKNLIPDAVLSKNNVDFIIDEVISIDKAAKTVKTSSGNSLTYKKLILATGSSPFIPPIPGINLPNVFTIKKDTEYLRGLLKALDQSENVVIIGGGFIGLEFGDECKKRGILNVTIIELLPHCLLLACDEEICILIENKLKESGINVLADNKVKLVGGKKRLEYVELENGEILKADVVILGIGAVPNVELAAAAGLATNKEKGVYVDEFMRTTDEDIFAAGDCTQKRCFFTGRPALLRLASIGTMEARVASANLFGLRLKSECPIGVFGTVIGDLAIGSAGMTERSAKQAGFDVFSGEFETPDKHPASMPNTKNLKVKLIFEKNSRVLLGGQAYGSMTAAKVANFIGALVQKRMRVDEIVAFQMGSHPMLTPSPIANHIANAAEIALAKIW